MRTKRTKTIISVSGRISSGKSHVANVIAKKFNFPIASFGGYLKYYCEQNGMPTDRKTLQDVGQKFINTNPELFLNNVINHFIGQSDSIIIEGVRHKIILDIIKQLPEQCISVFVDADPKTRFDRYVMRNKDSDGIKTYDQFVIADSHTVELDIESLKSLCAIVIDSTTDYEMNLLSEISKKKHG